jgi:hypothetical protein
MAIVIAVRIVRPREFRSIVRAMLQLEVLSYFIVPSPDDGGTFHAQIVGANVHAVNHP